MAGNKRIGAIIALDGEKEFKQAVSNVNAELKNLKAQTSYVKEEFKDQANSLAALEKKNELFIKTLDAQNRKQQEVEKGLKNSKKAYGEFGEKLEKLRKQYDSAESKLKKMESSSKSSAKEIETQRKEVERLRSSLEKSETNYQMAANRVQDWSSKLSKAKEEVLKAEKALKTNNTYLDEARSSADKCATSIDKYGKKIKTITKATLDWNEATKAAGAEVVIEKAADIAGNIASEAIQTAKDVTSAANQIQASTGIMAESAEKYQEVLLDVYKNNYGENMQDVANVISVVKQNMQDLNKQDLKKATESAITLRDTFDMDLNESIRGANALMEHMDVSATKAFDLIAKGAQKGLNKTDELGDNLAEYAQIWSQAGFSAEQMFAILDNGLNAGAYNLDKVNDFVKEFTISLSDGRIEENIGKFSLSTQELFVQLQQGKATASEVFQSIISDLGNMTNQQEALTLASTVWSALGEDNAMKVITSLNKVNDTYKNVEGTMNNIKNIKYDDLTNQITQTARTIQMKIAEPLAKKWLPEINEALEFTGDHLNEIGIVSMGLGGVITANKILSSDFGKSAIKVLKLVTTSTGAATAATVKQSAATKALTAQQKIYNAVASLNPATKIVIAVTAAIGAYKLLETAVVNSDEALVKNREEVEKLCEEYDELKSSIESAREERAETLASMETEYTSYQTLASNLEALAEKENKSNGEKALMKSYVDQLNEAIPSLNLAIDEQTGSLNTSTEAIYNTIDAMKEKAQYTAYEETLTAAYKEQADAELELEKLEAERADILNMMGERTEDLTAKMVITGASTKAYSDITKSSTAIFAQWMMKNGELEDQLKDVEDGISGCQEIIEQSNETITNTESKMKSYGDTYADLSEEVAAFTEVTVEAAETTITMTAEQAQAYEEFKNVISESLGEAISLTEEFSGGTEISAKKVLENLNSQINGMTTWADNMEKLAGAAGEGMTEEFYEYLAQLGPESANLIQELTNCLENNEGRFREICESWTEAMELKEPLAEEVASGFEVAQQKADISAAEMEEKFKQYGKQNTIAFAGGAESEKNEVEKASDTIVDTSISPIKLAKSDYYSMGKYLMEGLAKGISDNSGLVTQAVENVSSAASNTMKNMNQIKSPSRLYKKYGNYITEGLAIGIENAKSQAQKSMSNVCNGIVKTAKNNLDIHSPSKKFQKEVGEQITNGVAFGITAKKGTAIKNSKELADDVYKAASSWLTAYKKTHELSLDDEKYFWEKVAQTTKKGTEAYEKALKKISNITSFQNKVKNQISNNFGVTKEAGDSNEDYYDDILSAASKYLNNYSVLHNLSLQEEEYFWKAVQKKCKKGTQAYIDATKKLKEVQAEIAENVEEQQGLDKYYAYIEETIKNQEKNLKEVIGNSLSGDFTKAVSSSAPMDIADIIKDNRKKASHEIKQMHEDINSAIAEQMQKNVESNGRLQSETESYLDKMNQLASEKSRKINEEMIQENANLSKQLYTEAVKWLDDYKKTHNVSLADEKYYWQQILKSTEKGTTEYAKAMKQLKKLEGMTELQYNLQKQLKNVFDVSQYTIDTDGKKVKKSTEEYYSDIYSAAQQYFDNYSVFHTVSLKEEEEYWKAVLKKLKKGTQAYIDASKKLQEVQTEIKAEKEQEKQEKKDFALSGGALDAYKTYYQVSEKAEMQYWNKVRKKFKEGTAERIEADQKYFEAKEKYNNKLEELNEEYYENCKEVNEKLEDDINSLMDTYKEAVASRKESIVSSFNLFDEFSSTSSSGSTLLYNLKTQVAGIADWEQQLQKLGDKNILSDELLQELADMGPEASASIHALNQLSEEQLKEYQALWEQKNALAEAQAVKENEALREQTQAQIDELKSAAQEELNAYKEAYTEAVAEVKTAIEEPLLELASQATKIGEDTVYNMIAAIKDGATAKETSADLKKVNSKISSQLGKLEKAGKTIGDNTLQGIINGLTDTKKINSSAKSLVDALKKAIQKEADIHSPSRLFKKEIGEQLSAGVAEGLMDNSKTVNLAGTEMISTLLEKQKNEVITRQEKMKSYLASINDVSGISELNRLISVAPVQQVTASVDNSGLISMMSEMIAVMKGGFKEMANLQLVTDTGALIGETSSAMSEAFALMNRRRR